MGDFIIKIICNDKKGLIYTISDVLLKNSLNIEKNNEYVDLENGKFFYRAEVKGDVKKEELREQLISLLPKESLDVKVLKKRKKDIIIMATKEAHALGDILIKHYSNELEANILAVISNHNDLKELVDKFNIPYFYISHQGLSRIEHEKRILKVLEKYQFDYIILAKYMRILSSNFVSHFKEQIINIHHSFLPAFIGANPYKQAFQRGVKIIGATAHFVNDNLDEGPIIAQDVIYIDHTYSWREMQKAGRNVESKVLAQAINLVFNDRIFVNSNKTIIF